MRGNHRHQVESQNEHTDARGPRLKSPFPGPETGASRKEAFTTCSVSLVAAASLQVCIQGLIYCERTFLNKININMFTFITYYKPIL